MRPDQILPRLLAADAARPRVTSYDDRPGPTRGERIELSGKVLANWVAKAGNLLQEEYDAGPGTRVGLDLPAEHWRAVYWAFAVWSVGATLVLADTGDVDVLVTADPARVDDAPEAVLVTLAALARGAGVPTGGALDEARQLATYGDRFDPWQRAGDDDPALAAPGRVATYADLVGPADPGERRHVAGAAADVLVQVAATLAADGSVVLVRDADPASLPGRLSTEGVTAGM